MDPVKLYGKLKRVADAPSASDTERNVATARMVKLVEEHGDEIFRIKRVELRPGTPAEAQLILHIAAANKLTLTQTPGVFTLSGHPDEVDRVLEDLKVYAAKLEDILHVALVGALKGFGVYTEGRGSGEPTQTKQVEVPYAVQQGLGAVHQGSHIIARYYMRVNHSIKKLPAPKVRTPLCLNAYFDFAFRLPG